MSEKKIEAVNGHTLQKVFLSVEDHIAVMTLHNPPVNAADGVVQEEILLLCDYINHEDDIWVCIMHYQNLLRGRGHQAILSEHPG